MLSFLVIVQSDATRLGGVTGWLKVVALAEAHHRPLSPHLLPEIGVHLACGLPAVTSVEYMPWLYPLFANPPKIEQGRLVPLSGAGLGLEIDAENVAKYRVTW